MLPHPALCRVGNRFDGYLKTRDNSPKVALSRASGTLPDTYVVLRHIRRRQPPAFDLILKNLERLADGQI